MTPVSGTSGSGVDAAQNPMRRLNDDEVADWWARDEKEDDHG